MRSGIVVASFTLALMGCASKSSDIMPAYVSPVTYQSYTCQQLGLELKRFRRGLHRSLAPKIKSVPATRSQPALPS